MGFKNGKVFAFGHALVPCVFVILFLSGNRDASLLAITGISFLWSLLLVGFSMSDRPFFEYMGPSSHIFYSLVDFLLLGAAFTVPFWDITPHPTWLVLFLVSLYAFELGLGRSILFGFLSLFDIYLYCTFQNGISFFSLDTLLIVSGMLLSISFIGPTADRLNRMAYYDSLTGLPNRRMFTERLQAVLHSQSHEHKKRMTGVLFLDVDGFKYINDTMGHLLGDQLLKSITGRLRKVLPKQVLLARMGGDEFALYIPSMKTPDDAAALAQVLLKQFNASFSLRNQEIYVTTSIGITMSPDHGKDADTLMRNADTAMYLAKDQGRNDFQVYSEPADKEGVERIRMETMLRHALERNEFVVYYQPRVEVSTGNMVCVEALIRWIHPDRGMIPPAEFIPLAEDTGLIVPIGESVLRKVCAQRKQWNEMGLPPFRVSVNLSARQFRQSELPEVIQDVLRSTGMKAEMLELELTESAAMQDVNYAILMLKMLKEMGMTIAIDDFGTGYSSLSYLKKLPLDVLKIDKSFTSGIHQDSDDAAIVQAIIAMGHSLKLSITAEGVETNEQLQYLEELGCNEIQGYLIGKPMSPEVLEQWYRLTFNGEGRLTAALAP
jgi:diguanylate cyclase (GGDEF)-like protein